MDGGQITRYFFALFLLLAAVRLLDVVRFGLAAVFRFLLFAAAFFGPAPGA